MTSISRTSAPGTVEPSAAENTTPAGSIHSVASVRGAPQPSSVAVTTSPRIVARTRSPEADVPNEPPVVGSSGVTRNMPVAGPVSIAITASTSSARLEAIDSVIVSRTAGRVSQPGAEACTNSGAPGAPKRTTVAKSGPE